MQSIPDLEKKDPSGNAPLHLAAKEGHTDVIKTLLGLGTPVNLRNLDGETALHLAAEAGHKEVVKVLLDSGADPTLQDNNAATPCHLAAAGGFLEIMEMMSKSAAIESCIKGLHNAAEEGSVKELTKLLVLQPPLDEKNERGETPLYVATARGHCELAEILLQAGADPTIATEQGSTVLHAAAKSGLASIIDLCIKYKPKNLIRKKKYVSGDNKEEKKDRTREKKPSKGWQDIYKKCEKMALTDLDAEDETTVEHQIPIVQEYFKKLFSPEVKEEELEQLKKNLHALLGVVDKTMNVHSNLGGGSTLLHLAAVCCAEDTVKVLLKRKANLCARTVEGVTPLMMGCAGGSLEVVKILVEAGADVNERDYVLRTALHHAVRCRSVPVTKYLLSQGLDPNAQDRIGNTPLHIAALFRAGHDVIKALLDAGGDLLVRNNDDLFPFFLALNDISTFRLLHPPIIDLMDL